MRTILNIIWLILSGFWLFLAYALAGIIMCILIITIPFGVQAFKLAKFSLWPFGRTVTKKDSAGAGSVIGNIIWLVLAGWWLAISHIVTAAALAITIIGIPLAIANLKLIPVALWPFGREIIETDDIVGPFTVAN
ncbi:MAG: YccF domain-containing protein [Thermoleophilaceae bacterium]|nr:YccF domain-containing protein [Thermoleophilaceae bacterium]